MNRRSHFYPGIDWYGDPHAKNVVVWLPAFGDSGTMTARPYIQMLRLQGWTVMVTNHNQAGFRMDDTVDDVLSELRHSLRERVLLVGASFGAQILVEVLRRPYASSQRGLFSVVCVCGVSSGKDTHRPIGWSRFVHGPISGALFKRGLIRDIDRGTKSPFDEEDPEVAASIKPHEQFRKWYFTGQALLEQMYAMATTPAVRDGEFPDIPALIITTKGKDHLLKPQAAVNLAKAFSPSWRQTVDLSIHCDLTELPSQYGPKIWRFAQRIIETSPSRAS